jgi:hypothetical protein
MLYLANSPLSCPYLSARLKATYGCVSRLLVLPEETPAQDEDRLLDPRSGFGRIGCSNTGTIYHSDIIVAKKLNGKGYI